MALEKPKIYGKIDIRIEFVEEANTMTRRQQLILFVLALATLSTCTVGFALTMNLVRDRSRAETFVDLPPATRQAQAESTAEGIGWSLPPTPTPPPTETRQPTPTNTHVPTWTPAPTYTPTPTRVPTDTPPPPPTPTKTPQPAAASAPAAPKPANPSPTPTPEFPFLTRVATADTGTPQMTRVTGLAWQGPTLPNGVAGYQMRLVDPNGGVHLSDVSGPGGTHSTCKECGDDHWMNMKVELPGYQPGTYTVTLVQGEKQVSTKATFTLTTAPLQYIHIDFVPWELPY
jgi:hypothetical protein